MAADKGALSGIRVVDFGQYIAGPLSAVFLADNGGDAIPIDPSGGPQRQHSANATLQRGKRVINLDLKAPAGQAMARSSRALMWSSRVSGLV
jgi:crotonobetainyl-CoA:carnitine CoA-transferase CaiB-like acyl-CoA transferase